MKKKKGLFTRLPFFVLIFSVYPSLALLSTNIREVELGVVVRPFLASLLGAIILSAVVQVLFRNWARTSIVVTTFLVFFFSYGHITRLISDRFDPSLNRTIQAVVYLLFIVLLIAALRWIARLGSNINDWIGPLNIVAIVLVLFPVMEISGFAMGAKPSTDPIVPTPESNLNSGTNQTNPVTNPISTPGDPSQYPDVYLIVLDGYSRADTLEVLGYDNSEFLNSLEGLGFYVADCSRSNYRHTLLSMSSTFSMDLLWRAIPNGGPSDHDPSPLYDVLIHNRVRSDFEQRGYTIVGFQTGYKWDQWMDADYYLVPPSDTTGQSASAITPFEYIFLKNTAIYPFIENSPLAVQRYYGHYSMIQYTLEELPKIATSIPGPKFVYAHFMIPHAPYIFLPDGSLNTDSRYYNLETGSPSNPQLEVEGYINNIKYLNTRVTPIMESIIHDSKTPPIIILMGDHGNILNERRFNNLMAFHFPNGGNASLYPTITPINAFRLVSNLYFGTDMPLRNDVSNDGDVGRPYIQKVVPPFPETCP